ncbi:hypothetical protein LJC11_04175 [Bacteroidales bacterium OttesenSCG-928-I21]|nr:hypothetical protein [Bacteroidales bacterium OttesenSCG-928-I21]
MDILIIIIFLLFGIILLLAEIFLLPGISIAGIAGVLFLAGGIVYAFTIDFSYGIYSVVFAAVALCFAIYYFMKSKTLDKLSLHTEIDGKVETFEESDIKVGDKGMTVSRLAPMGKVKINNIILEAKSSYDFIDEDVEIEVVAVNKTNVEVREVKNEE